MKKTGVAVVELVIPLLLDSSCCKATLLTVGKGCKVRGGSGGENYDILLRRFYGTAALPLPFPSIQAKWRVQIQAA